MIASIWAGVKWYLKPGMFGEPSAICFRGWSSPIAKVAFDKTGPNTGLVSVGLV